MSDTEVDDQPGYQMRVYRFALRGDLPTEGVEELRRAHQLRNNLVEIERAYAELVARTWATHPELGTLEEARDVAQEALTEAVEAAKDERRRLRTTKPTAETKRVLTERRKALRDAKLAFREAKERLYPVIKPELTTAREWRKAQIKGLYATSVEGGLYWASYNEVVAHHDTTMKMIASKRAQGQKAEVHFHSWTGEGTLAVQLQRGANHPPRTPETLADPDGRWRNVFSLSHAPNPEDWKSMTRAQQRASVRNATVRFRIGSEAQWVVAPVIMHRAIPLDADIVMARITRERWAGRHKCFVSIVCRVAAAPQVTEGGVSAVHMGWRKVADGIRVAVCAAPTPPPANIRPVLRDNGGWWEVVLPTSWVSVYERTSAVRGQRDLNLETLKKQMTEWADANPDAIEWALANDFEDLTGWDKKRSFGWFASVTGRIRSLDDGHPLGELYDILEPWRRQDRHLWEWEVNESRQIIGRRRDLYRNVAAWLCQEAAMVAVDSWSPSMTKPPVGEEDSAIAEKARSTRVFAAPAELRMAVENAAQARGVTVERPITVSVHHRCGTEIAQEDRRDDVLVWCSTCKVVFDQDHNTLVQMRNPNVNARVTA